MFRFWWLGFEMLFYLSPVQFDELKIRSNKSFSQWLFAKISRQTFFFALYGRKGKFALNKFSIYELCIIAHRATLCAMCARTRFFGKYLYLFFVILFWKRMLPNLCFIYDCHEIPTKYSDLSWTRKRRFNNFLKLYSVYWYCI